MVRKILVVGFILVFAGSVSAEIQYSGEVDRDQILMNATVELECDERCPVNSFQLSWNLPSDAEILGIEDNIGEIDDYTRDSERITFSTNSGERRRNETVRIRMRVDREAENIYKDLQYRRFSIPSLSGEKTTGKFYVEDLISGWIGYGFNTSFSGNEFRFSGEGPTNFRVNFGEGQETEYYEYFGELRQNGSEAYKLAVGTTGRLQEFDRFPVAVMDDKTFNETVNRWSDGEYTAGTLTLRKGSEGNHLPLLAHETVHGLNDKFLSWDRTDSSYLDEGVAEYTEFLMKRKLYRQGRKEFSPPELFGEKEEYEVNRDGKKYIYEVPPQGEREILWRYYQNDQDFMKAWNPNDNTDFRRFGYAYSQLIIRNHVANGSTVRELYELLNFDGAVDSRERKWDKLSEKIDLTPCKYESRQGFEECLDKINEYEYRAYSAIPDRKSRSLDIREIEIPERKSEKETGKNLKEPGGNVSLLDFVSGFVEYLLSLIKNV